MATTRLTSYLTLADITTNTTDTAKVFNPVGRMKFIQSIGKMIVRLVETRSQRGKDFVASTGRSSVWCGLDQVYVEMDKEV